MNTGSPILTPPRLRFEDLPLTRHELESLQANVDQAAVSVAAVFGDLPPEARARCIALANELGKLNVRLMILRKR